MRRGKKSAEKIKALVGAMIREGLVPENCKHYVYPERMSPEREAEYRKRLADHFKACDPETPTSIQIQ